MPETHIRTGTVRYITDEKLRACLTANPERTRTVMRQARTTRRVKHIAEVTGLTPAQVQNIIRPRFEGRNAAFMRKRFAQRRTHRQALDDALAAARRAGWSLGQISEALGVTRQYLNRVNPSGDVPQRAVRFTFDPPLRFSDPARVPAYALSNPGDVEPRQRLFTALPAEETATLTRLLDKTLARSERRVGPNPTVSPQRVALEQAVAAEAQRLVERHGIAYSTLSRACGRSAYVIPRIMAHHGHPEALPASLAAHHANTSRPN